MPEIALNLNSSYSFIFFILMVLAGLFSYFIYRYTNPPIPKRYKILLFILRTIALCVLIFMLTEPIATFTNKSSEDPIIAVFIDRSKSMELKDFGQETTRLDRAKHVIGEGYNLLNELKNKGVVNLFSFAKNAQLIEDEDIQNVSPDGGSTNIGDALNAVSEELAQENFSAAVLLSDGANNGGRDPIRVSQNLGIPVHSIGIGDPSEPKDVAISKYLTNEIAYMNNQIPVEVNIQTNGFSGGETTISLREGNKTLDTKNITLTDEFQEHKVILHFIPKTSGLHKYELTIPVQEDEKITQNNKRQFFVKVLKSKIKILSVFGAPSWDYNFITNSLRSDPNVELTSYTTIKNDQFYLQEDDGKERTPAFLPRTTREWNQYDLIMLGNISLKKLSSNQEKLIAEFVNEQGKAVLFFGGENAFNRAEYYKSPLKDLIPVALKGGTMDNPFQIELTASGKQSSVLMVDDDPSINDRMWHEFPPILTANRLGKSKPNSQVMAIHPVDKNPLIATSKIGRGKTMIIGFSSIWRWSFMMEGIGKSNVYFDRLWSNIVRWLVTREVDKQVKIETDKIIYRSGEEIYFTGQVYNQNYQPIDDATVDVKINQQDNPDFSSVKISLISTPTGEGTYSGKFSALPPGDYTFIGTARRDDRIIGNDDGKFTVGEYSLEYENTKQDVDKLKRIASVSDGKYFYYEDCEQLLDELDVEEREITRVREVALWDNTWFFIILVLLLGSEWWIRKRKGLA